MACSSTDAGKQLQTWVEHHFRPHGVDKVPPVPVIGKNAGTFDIPFLVNRCDVPLKIWHRRIIDPTALWIEPTDEIPPSLFNCMKRAGLKPQSPHDAIEDAWNTIRVFRAGLARLK